MPETITIAEIKTLIKEEEIQPSDLFDNDALTSDPVVKGFVRATVKEETTSEYVARKRKEEGFDKKSEDWEKERVDKDKKIKELEIKNAKRDAADLFTTKIKERKLDKKQSQFVASKQKDFVPDDIENLDKEVDKFMDSTVDEYKDTAKIFGVKAEESTKEETKEETGSPSGSEEQEEEADSLIPD